MDNKQEQISELIQRLEQKTADYELAMMQYHLMESMNLSATVLNTHKINLIICQQSVASAQIEVMSLQIGIAMDAILQMQQVMVRGNLGHSGLN